MLTPPNAGMSGPPNTHWLATSVNQAMILGLNLHIVVHGWFSKRFYDYWYMYVVGSLTVSVLNSL